MSSALQATLLHKPLNLTPQGLFPDKENPDQDSKCKVIAALFQELDQTRYRCCSEQKECQDEAKNQYNWLSKEKRISIFIAAVGTMEFLNRGVSPATAKGYFEHRISAEDAVMWDQLDRLP